VIDFITLGQYREYSQFCTHGNYRRRDTYEITFRRFGARKGLRDEERENKSF